MQFFIFCIFLATLGHVSVGVPLETPSENFDRYFTPFIVGGVDATKEVSKYTAAIVVGEHVKTLVCGGSIVTKSCILTAAHCIEPHVSWTGVMTPTYHGIVGKTEWDKGTEVRFKDSHIHPNWNSTIIKYDVGVLRLTEELILNEKIGLISLGYDWIGAGVAGYVAGWGLLHVGGRYPTKLQVIQTNTIPFDICDFEVAMQGALRGGAPPVYDHVEICTLHSFGVGTCNGDSGSALVSVETNKQIGITSWGFPCALGAPDMFTRVSGIKDFLLEKLKECLGC